MMGRPVGLKDGPCLERLVEMGFARKRDDGRYVLTEGGRSRHTTEILKRTVD
jgi:hypothetical protein